MVLQHTAAFRLGTLLYCSSMSDSTTKMSNLYQEDLVYYNVPGGDQTATSNNLENDLR